MPEQGKPDSMGAAAKEVATSFRALVRSEMRLALAEARESVQRAGRDSLQIALAAALAALALLPFMAFLIVGLGRILGGNYWLSSLLVGVLFLALSVGLALHALHRIRAFDLSFPHLRTVPLVGARQEQRETGKAA